MGNLATPEALIARWDEVRRDPSLRDLPYKIELNAWGKVEMSPASRGTVLPDCSILTRIGIRAPDVGWASATFFARNGEITPYTRAPEICAEVFSPSNTPAEIAEKTAAYLAAGAVEVWIVAENGTIRYFTAAGEQPKSAFPVAVSLPPPVK